jgi:osmoprotectant transport system permease protein
MIAGPFAAIAAWAPTIAQFGPNSDFFKQRTATCVSENKTFCFDWAAANADRYVTPTLQHIVLVVVPVGLGFLIAFGLALIAHRRGWLEATFTGITGVLFTIPSLAFFSLLLPVTGRGTDTAIIALTAYTLNILFRNIVSGLANVPDSAKDAGRGMGMSDRQLLWAVELPLAVPEIIGGLRIATVSTVAIATLAVFAGAGGLGTQLYPDNFTFKTGIIIIIAIVIVMATAFDAILVGIQRLITPWRQVRPA